MEERLSLRADDLCWYALLPAALAGARWILAASFEAAGCGEALSWFLADMLLGLAFLSFAFSLLGNLGPPVPCSRTSSLP